MSLFPFAGACLGATASRPPFAGYAGGAQRDCDLYQNQER